jgi:phosphomannomutase
VTDAVLEAARSWITQDPDPETRAELEALVTQAQSGSASALAELHSRFDSRLAFGTAGLRGELGAGPNRMNRVLVAQAAAGLAAFLAGRVVATDAPSVVIGFDGRKNSRIFATDTAEILAGAGVRALLLPRPLPTPVLAFAVRHTHASAGVMVTASHNPASDNGYKVYLGDADHGSQIVPPADTAIAACIGQIAGHCRVPELPRSTGYETADESIIDAYVTATASIATRPTIQQKVVYTAMHGVGWEIARRVFVEAGFAEPTVVREQIEPDPSFPTVAFPNPEEPGALDLAFETARAVGADLIIANDPDADRLAIALPDAGTPDGYRRLTGNDVGALLGWFVAEHAAANGGGTLAASIVSSPALASVASAYGLRFEETLTGFKWVSRVANLTFGFEEALGYLVNPQTVRDKDGISAAVLFLDLAARRAERGETIGDMLNEFAERFGSYASDQISIRVSDLSEISRVMTNLRAHPPESIGPFAVERVDDFATGIAGLPASDVVRITLAGGSRVMVRPSGTEPKLKIYVDASSDEGSVSERQAKASARVRDIAAAMRVIVA